MQHILEELEDWAHDWANHVQKAVTAAENEGKLTTLVEMARELARILAEMKRLIEDGKSCRL